MNDLQVFNAIDEGCVICELIRDIDQNAIDFRIIEINPAMERLLGVPRDNVVGHLASEVHSNKYKEWMTTLESAVKSVIPKRVEQYNRTAGRWLEIKASPIGRDQVVVLFDEITERRNAEETLRLSEQRLQRVLETDAVGVLFFDQNGYVIQANHVFLTMTGYSRQQIARRELTWRKMTPPEWIKDSEVQMERYEQTGRIGPYEKEYFLADGSRRWMLFAGRAVGDGTIAEYCIDISERKRIEAALQQSQRTFQQLIERAPFGIYVVDSQFRIAHMNASSQAGAFRNAQPVIGRDFADAIHILWPEETASGIVSAFRHTLETGEPYYSPRFTNPRQDVAAVESYEWELQRMVLPDGQYGVICYYYDSTKLRNAEAAVRENEERYRIVGEVIPFGVWESDVEGNATYLSPLFLELTGQTLEEHRQSWQTLIHAEETNSLVKAWRECVQSGNRWDQEFRIRGKEGNYYAIHARGLPVYNSAGEITSYVGINFDVTDHRRVEEALRESERQLQVLNATLEGQVQEKTAQVHKLAADVTNAVQRERHRISHILHDDIQQRIYAIHMQLTFLRNGLQKYSEEEQREASDIETQLLEVLEITRHLSIDLSPPILREEGLTQAISWLAHRMFQQYGLPIEIQADQPFAIQDEELHVFLFSCVREILFNTVKHAEARHAMVTLRWVENCLEIKIQDNGKGFPAGRSEEKSEEERTPPSLGIPTIRQQLSLFGGTMDIQSAPATGTSILITVPIPERS